MQQLIERLEASGNWWMIGKGKARAAEPLFGCLIQEPHIDGSCIAKTEGDSIEDCIERALQQAAAAIG